MNATYRLPHNLLAIYLTPGNRNASCFCFFSRVDGNCFSCRYPST
uniref:Uncharacterized protein n=1 Tax=Anguilla anguilla TaxID=7936 RepID=A0A0E9S8E7_ANGAN